MWQGLARLRGWLNLDSRKRRRRPARRKQSELFPTLQVRTLEERRVFHAGAIVAPVAGASTQPTPPPPPSTTVTLDAGHNLLVQDMSVNGQNDQLSIGFDKTSGNYVITDPTQTLVSEIQGAQGSGSHQLLIPVQAVSGDKVIVATGGGDDALTVNLVGGLGGKTLTFDGGSGQDSLTLVGGSYNTVGYAFLGDGTTQIQIGDGSNAAEVDLKNVEPVFDQLAAGVRQFSLDGAITEATLTGDVTSGGRQGTLTTSLGASVTFVMPSTSLTLGAGEACQVQIVGQIDLDGGDLTVRSGAIEVSGTITTHDATIDITSQSSLTLSASGILENEAGQSFLDAGDSGTLTVSGRIDVSAPLVGRGGTVRLLGQWVELQDPAVIDASGTAGGGTVLVGGDYQGLNPAIHNATNVLVSAGAKIDANALEQGDGGKIIVWANDTAIVAGSGNLHARGGPNGGNGGLIETSGKQHLEVGTAPDASGPAGAAGTWLLDPIDVTIVSSGGAGTLSGGVFTSDNTHTTIDSAIIATALATMNVTINTGNGSGNGDIIINDAILPGAVGSHTLTLNADRDIVLNDDITDPSGTLSVVLNADRNVTFAAGAITANQTTITAGGTVKSGSAANDITAIGAGAAISITADSLGTAAAPLQLSAGLTGTVSLTASLGVIYVEFDGDIATSQLTLSDAGNGQTISLESQFGSITVDNTSGFAPNTANDNFMLSTPTGGVLFDGATLTAAGVDIDADLFIVHLGPPGLDIDTSAKNGDITLNSGGPIGSSLAPLGIDPGGGHVSATTSGLVGDIFVQFDASISTSQLTLSVVGINQTIELTTSNGSITFDSVAGFNSNTQDDNFVVQTQGASRDIDFKGVTLTAHSVALSATGDITASSATLIADTTVGGGPISLTGKNLGSTSVPLRVKPGAAGLALTATNGDIFIRLPTGNLTTSKITTLSAGKSGATISLQADTGSILIDQVSQFNANTNNDDFQLTAGNGDITLSANSSLLAANEILTAHTGNIVATVATTQITTSNTGLLKLDTKAIGSATAPIIIDPGTGSIQALASTGDVYLTFVNSFATSQFANLSVGTSARQIALASQTGSITVDSVQHFNNTNDDNFTLLAPAGSVSFTTGATLTGRSVTIDALTTISRSGTASTDIDTSLNNGAIHLTANDGIGSTASPLRVKANAGVVEATTVGGSIWLTSPDINLGQIQTGGGQQTVSVSTTTGDLNVVESSATDDDWELNAGGDLSLIGAVTIQAATFSKLQATGNIVGGDATVDFNQLGPTGGIIMNAAAIGSVSQPILVDLDPTLQLNLTANSGDLCVLLADGNLTGSQLSGSTVTAPTIGSTVLLGTENGSIDFTGSAVLGGLAGDKLRLEAHGVTGDILLGDQTLVFAQATLIADGRIISSGLVPSIDTSAANGDISLQSVGVIGTSPLLPFIIEAGRGQVSAVTTGPTGNIYLQSTANLLLGNIEAQDTGTQTISVTITGGPVQINAPINTDDVLLFAAQGDISFATGASISATSVSLTSFTGAIHGSGGSSPDIDTSASGGLIVLSGQAIGDSGKPLLIKPGSGPVAIASLGDVFINLAGGGFAFSQFGALNLTAGANFSFGVQSGSLNIDTTLAALGGENVTLSAGTSGATARDITISPGEILIAQSVNLHATGKIQGGGNPADVVALSGNILLSGDQGIGASAAAPLAVFTSDPAGFVSATTTTGNIYLTSPGQLRFGTVRTGAGSQDINLQAANGMDIVASSSTNDTWTIGTNSGDLHFVGGSSIIASEFTADVAGTIFSDGSGSSIDTTTARGAGGAISLTGASIGQAIQPLALKLATGDLSLESRTGDIAVDISGGALHGGQIKQLKADAAGATVSLTTLAGSIVLDDLSHFQVADDLLSLTAQGVASDIDFAGNVGPLTAAQVTLNAGGSILSSGGASLDIDTSLVGNPLQLSAGVNIGMQTAPLIVLAGTGNVSATAATGDIYIQSPGPLTVDNAVASGANRQISFETTGTNNPLLVSVTSLGNGDQWHLLATGDIALHVADAAGVQLGQIAEIQATAGFNVLIDASAGPLVIDSIQSGFDTTLDHLTLRSGGDNITSPRGAVLDAAMLSLEAPAGQIGDAVHPIAFVASQLTTSSGGSQWLATGGATRIGLAETTAPGQNITLTTGTFLLDAPSHAAAVRTIGGTLVVGSTAMLGGSGAVAGNLEVRPSGIIDMGFATGETGDLQVMGNVTLDDRAVLVIDINPPYAQPGKDYDHLSISGNLMLVGNPTLDLKGAAQLSTTINPIVLVELTTPGARTIGNFDPNGGSLFVDNGLQHAGVGLFRGRLFYDGGTDNNDIVLSQLSFTPPLLRPAARLPLPNIPVFTLSESPLPIVQVPPILTTAVTPPAIEEDLAPVGVRYIEVRIIVPIDEAGNVREEFAMKLPAEWLSNLPAILRRLPDDRYRIYLILEGGNEERQVLDVLVRNGRPVEPTDTNAEGLDSDVAESLPTPAPLPPAVEKTIPAGQPLPGTAAPEVLREPLLFPSGNSAPPTDGRGASRFYLGAGMAAAAVIASRQSSRPWADEVDRAAAVIGRAGTSRAWRLWRFATNRQSKGPQ